MIYIYSIGVLTAFFTMFLNYCMGKPGSKEFSPYEIFSSYTVWLSKRRLKKAGLWKHYLQQYNESFISQGIKCSSGECRFDHKLVSLKNDFKKIIYDAADPFFTWERAVGMCPVCTGVWLSGIGATFCSRNVVDLIIIIVVSHVVIRILNKII